MSTFVRLDDVDLACMEARQDPKFRRWEANFKRRETRKRRRDIASRIQRILELYEYEVKYPSGPVTCPRCELIQGNAAVILEHMVKCKVS
jgi:hypothetical protein